MIHIIEIASLRRVGETVEEKASVHEVTQLFAQLAMATMGACMLPLPIIICDRKCK